MPAVASMPCRAVPGPCCNSRLIRSCRPRLSRPPPATIDPPGQENEENPLGSELKRITGRQPSRPVRRSRPPSGRRRGRARFIPGACEVRVVEGERVRAACRTATRNGVNGRDRTTACWRDEHQREHFARDPHNLAASCATLTCTCSPKAATATPAASSAPTSTPRTEERCAVRRMG